MIYDEDQNELLTREISFVKKCVIDVKPLIIMAEKKLNKFWILKRYKTFFQKLAR